MAELQGLTGLQGGLLPPGGFAYHQRGHLFRLDLAHVGLDAALPAGINPDVVADILPRLVGFYQSFYPAQHTILRVDVSVLTYRSNLPATLAAGRFFAEISVFRAHLIVTIVTVALLFTHTTSFVIPEQAAVWNRWISACAEMTVGRGNDSWGRE